MNTVQCDSQAGAVSGFDDPTQMTQQRLDIPPVEYLPLRGSLKMAPQHVLVFMTHGV